MDAFFVERVVLQLLLTDDKVQSVFVPVFDENLFFDPGNIALGGMIREFVDKHNSIPTYADLRFLCASEHRKNKDIASASLEEVEKINLADLNMENVVSEAEMFIRFRKGSVAANSVIEAIGAGMKDEELFARADATLSAVHFKFDNDFGLDPFADFDRFFDELHHRSACFSTGWETLDRHTRGGIPRGGLYLGIAETNFGKSAWLTSLAANQITLGRKVLYVTAESDAPRIAERVLRSTLGITGDELYRSDRETLRAKVDTRVREGFANRFVVKKIRSANTSAVRHLLKEHKTRGMEFDVVIVDYLQLFQPTRKLYRANTNEEMKWVTNELDDLSYEYNCGMVSVAQIRRDEYAKSDYDISAVAEGITIAHNATVVWGMMQTAEQKAMGEVTFKLLKNRLGSKDHKEILRANLDYMRFSDVNAVIGPDNRVVLTKIVPMGNRQLIPNDSRAELQSRLLANKSPESSQFRDTLVGESLIASTIPADDFQIDWGE